MINFKVSYDNITYDYNVNLTILKLMPTNYNVKYYYGTRYKPIYRLVYIKMNLY